MMSMRIQFGGEDSMDENRINSNIIDISFFLLIIAVVLMVSCHHLSGIKNSLEVIAEEIRQEESL